MKTKSKGIIEKLKLSEMAVFWILTGKANSISKCYSEISKRDELSTDFNYTKSKPWEI